MRSKMEVVEILKEDVGKETSVFPTYTVCVYKYDGVVGAEDDVR